MRPRAEQAPEVRPADRDRDLESRYSFDREGMASTLAYVYARREELAREYLDWRYGRDVGSIREELPRFEAWRFGSELFEAAHGLLLCAVLCEAFPDDPKAKLLALPKPQPGKVGTPERLAKGMRMPHAPGKAAWAERSQELYRQAQEIEAEVIE